jgi:pimeloyl-[acyl-carrier protein] methyl ester esterase
MYCARVSEAAPAAFDGAVSDVAVPGGAIRVETLGQGWPVLLLHGWTLDRRVWVPQAQALADRYRIVALDRRGNGGSSAPPDMTRETDDILAVAEQLGLERFALVGMSQGARVAMRFAIDHPDRVTALILQGAPLSDLPGEAEDEPPVARMAALAGAGKLAEMRDLWRDHPLMQVTGDAAKWLDPIAADYAGRDLAARAALDVTQADCARIAAPILAITGANEPASRHRVAQALERVAGAERLDVPGCGHLCNLERADIYNAALAAFIAAHDGSNSGTVR